MNSWSSNNILQQTVRPVTSVAVQRPRQAVPQLTLECWCSTRMTADSWEMNWNGATAL
jgi:hypothetical protein